MKHTQTSTKMAEREGEPAARRIAYVGNSQLMLRDIKQSLRHLSRQPDQRPEATRISQQSATPGSNVATVAETTLQANASRPMAQNSNRRISTARALAEIRSSLKPFETTESGYSSCSESGEAINKQFLSQLKAMGLDEVRIMKTVLCISRAFIARGH